MTSELTTSPQPLMVTGLFAFTISAELLACACSAYSLISPSDRIWPSPRLLSWQSYVMWALFLGSAIGIVLLGLLDWGGAAWSPWFRYLVGTPLWLFGQGFSLWSILSLGIKPTFGAASRPVLRGPYAFSRNPQYLGYSVGLFGWALVSGSKYTLGAAVMGMLAFYLASHAEEGYLKRRYGAEYEQYLRAVPRFFSISRPANDD